MLRFNLIPPELRTRFIFLQKAKHFSRYGNILLGLLAMFSLFLLFALVYLQKQQAFFADELTAVRETPQNIIIEKVRKSSDKFNEELKTRVTNTPSVDWYTFLTELTDFIPPDVALKSIGVTQANASPQIVLEGEASERQVLRTFEDTLRSSPLVKDLISPLANYRRTEDIMFTFSFTLVPPKR